MTKNEESGLKSLLKRIEKEEIIVMKTDKSGRFVVTTPDKYKEMGEEHTNKGEEIEWNTVREMERRINSHTIAWELIWNTGEDHKHQDRIIRSKATRSGNQANLTLLYKDHKVGDKTRPVASGNESYNLGLSNGLSEVMESVAKAIKSPYSVISAEDMLARIHIYNASITGKDDSEIEKIDVDKLETSTVPPEGAKYKETSGEVLETRPVPPEGETYKEFSGDELKTSTVQPEDEEPSGRMLETSPVPPEGENYKESSGDELIASTVPPEGVNAQIGPLKREVPGPAGRSLGPLFPGAQSQTG